MNAMVAAIVALAVPGCHAPECLVQVGADPAVAAGPLRLDVQRAPARLTVELSRPALLTLRTRGQALDRWLAPAGTSVHPVPPAGRGALRLVAVDGVGSTATRVLPTLERASYRPAGPPPSPMRA
jgi:hypothetical protein